MWFGFDTVSDKIIGCKLGANWVHAGCLLGDAYGARLCYVDEIGVHEKHQAQSPVLDV